MGGEKGKGPWNLCLFMSVKGAGLLGFSDSAVSHIPKQGKHKNGGCLTANWNAVSSSFLIHKSI